MNKSIVLILVLAFITASFTVTIHPIKADSRTFGVVNSNQLVNAIYGASDGDTIFVMKGTYEIQEGQTLVISKSISLVGEDPDNTIIKLHPAWEQQGWNYLVPVYDFNHPIEILASDVEISGLTISSDGGSILATGIRIQIRNSKIMTRLLVNGRYQNVSQNTIRGGIGCYGSYNTIAGNRIVGDGIVVGGSWGSSNMIYDNIVTDGDGISLIDYAKPYAANGNTFFNNTVKNCSSGLVVRLYGYSSNNTVYANTLADNDIGLALRAEGSNNTFYHNNLVDNKQQVSTDSSGFLDNGKEGNYWSDYAGNDTNGDGVGDTPYGQDRYPLMYPWGAPDVSVYNLENATHSGSVSLNFTVNKPTSWIGYSLDGFDNVTITGNTTLTGISSGLHNITVYAKDEFENTGTSETITFTIAKEPESFPIRLAVAAAIVVAAVVLVAAVGVGLSVYLKKRK